MRRTWRAQLFIIAYLAVQVALPVRAMILGARGIEGESRRDFAWDVYARLMRPVFAYAAVAEDGSTRPLPLADAFRVPSQYFRVLRRDRLPLFHAWLCESLQRDGRDVRVFARVAVASQSSGPVPLARTDVDVCRAENYGVRVD